MLGAPPTLTHHSPQRHQAPEGSGRRDSDLTKCHLPLLAGAGLSQATLGSEKSGEPKG